MTIATLIVDVAANTSQIVRTTDDLNAKFDKLDGVVGNFAAGLLSAFTATAVIEGMRRMVTSALNYADSLSNLSAATSISVSGLQDLENIGISTGTSMETMARAVEMLHRKLDDPAARQAVEQMGLNYQRIREMQPEEQFLEIAKNVAKIEDPVARANAGAALFGKTWDSISAALQGDVEANLKSVHKLSTDEVAALDSIGDAWDALLLGAKRYSAQLVLLATSPTSSSLLKSGLAGGIFDTSLDALPGVHGPSGLTVANPLATMQLPDAGGKLNGLTTLKEELDRATKAASDHEAAVRKAADEWQRLRDRAGEGVHNLFQDFVELAKIGDSTGLARINTLLGLSHSNGMAAFGPGPVSLTGGFTPEGIGKMAMPGGIADVKGAAAANIAAATGASFADNLFSGVPAAIQAAIQGGGNKLQAAGSAIGMSIFGEGSSLTKTITGWTSKLPGVLGSALGSAVPIIGSLIGPAIEGIQKLFGKSEESSKVSPVRDEFFKMAGGLETLNPKVQQLTGNLSLVQNVLKAKTVEQYTAAMKDFDALQQQVNADIATANTTFGDISGKMSHLTELTPEVGSAIQIAMAAKTPEEFAAALGNVNGILDEQASKHQRLAELAQKYGLSLADMGPQFAQGRLDEMSKTLIDDWTDLAASGANSDAVIRGMAGSFNDLVANALKTGSSIPESLRDPLDKLAKMGLLTDDAGVKMEDLGKIKFSTTLQDHLDDLKGALDGLKDVLADLPAKFALIPRSLDFNVNTHVNTTGTQEENSAWTGGMVTDHGISHFAGGGMVGTDTVHAMLTPGEMVLTASQQRAVGALMSGGGGRVVDLQEFKAMRSEIVGLRRDMKEQSRRLKQDLATAFTDAVNLR